MKTAETSIRQSPTPDDLLIATTPVPGRLTIVPAPSLSMVDAHLALVDELLTDVLADLNDLWRSLPDETRGPLEILGEHDLPRMVGRLISSGKRLRPTMAYLGWLGGGGGARGIGHRDVVRVGAALELLHLFALVHDDIMDESASRRGRPTVHKQAERLHRENAGDGSSWRFGESIAVLVGDLAHAETGYLIAELPRPMRRLWRILATELIAGQRRDLIGSASGRRDLEFARSVARMKSGRYTVERPIELGATAAHATGSVVASLAAYGKAVGEAFALRDDLLGIWGDPESTGKPAGDDLISGKPTVILALAEQRICEPAARAALNRVGSVDFTHSDLTMLRHRLETDGVVAEVEIMISSQVDAALSALDEPDLDHEGVLELTRMARAIAWRDR